MTDHCVVCGDVLPEDRSRRCAWCKQACSHHEQHRINCAYDAAVDTAIGVRKEGGL